MPAARARVTENSSPSVRPSVRPVGSESDFYLRSSTTSRRCRPKWRSSGESSLFLPPGRLSRRRRPSDRQLESKLGNDGRATAGYDDQICREGGDGDGERGRQSLDRNPFHKNRTIAKIYFPVNLFLSYQPLFLYVINEWPFTFMQLLQVCCLMYDSYNFP